jgi:hypothetical protein
MAKVKFVVPEVKQADYSQPMETGIYEGKIVEIRPTTIRSGRHAGKRSIDVAVQMPDGRYIWKVLPQFTATQFGKLSEGDKKWVDMSTVSFAKALGLSGEFEMDEVIGREVKVMVGTHQDNGYGVQNSIVKFLK